MKKAHAGLLSIFAAGCLGTSAVGRAPVDQYNVVWTSPSKNASESMAWGWEGRCQGRGEEIPFGDPRADATNRALFRVTTT